MSEKVFVFGDEFGTSALSQNDVKNITHFVYAAIVVKESKIKDALEVRDYISENFLKGEVIKSNSRALKKIDTRIKALDYLTKNLNFIVYAFVIDKEKLSKDEGGLRFKEVFYKYFQRIFLSQVNNNFNDFEIHMDNLINEKYQIELKNYLNQNYQNNFFEKYNISDDKEQPLIQLADLIAGSLGRIFNNDFKTERNEEIVNLLFPIIPKIVFFPPKEDNISTKENKDLKIDKEVFNIVRNDAEKILDNEIDNVIQCLLDMLLWNQRILPNNFIQTYEIVNNIKLNTGKETSIESLRLIIRDLRYKGVIIVSSSNKSGYKLAVNKTDVSIYFTHYLNYVIPMLKKVEIANNIFMNKTVGDYIPLNEMNELKNLVNSLSDNIN